MPMGSRTMGSIEMRNRRRRTLAVADIFRRFEQRWSAGQAFARGMRLLREGKGTDALRELRAAKERRAGGLRHPDRVRGVRFSARGHGDGSGDVFYRPAGNSPALPARTTISAWFWKRWAGVRKRSGISRRPWLSPRTIRAFASTSLPPCTKRTAPARRSLCSHGLGDKARTRQGGRTPPRSLREIWPSRPPDYRRPEELRFDVLQAPPSPSPRRYRQDWCAGTMVGRSAATIKNYASSRGSIAGFAFFPSMPERKSRHLLPSIRRLSSSPPTGTKAPGRDASIPTSRICCWPSPPWPSRLSESSTATSCWNRPRRGAWRCPLWPAMRSSSGTVAKRRRCRPGALRVI